MAVSEADAPASSPPSRGGVERLRRAVTWLVGTAVGNAEGAVYGTLMIGVLLAAEDGRRDGYPETIGAAAIVLVLYWLTSFYTHILGVRLRNRESLDRGLFWRTCTHELPIIEGALIPVLVLLIAWAAGAHVTGGVTAALWTAAISIVALELAAGWRARLSPRGLWLQAAAGVVMGIAILSLKLVLH